jgi:hypothetical protein
MEMQMLFRAFCYLLYALVLVPIAWVRRIGGFSPFSSSFHRAPSSWDRP